MPTASWNDRVIARTETTVIVEGNHYFPPESIDRSLVRPSATRTRCHWKGEAAYLDLVVDGEVLADGAWSYPEPLDAAAQIRDHVAFWKGVVVEA